MSDKNKILLKMAVLKRDWAKKELERYQELARHEAESTSACDKQQLELDLAECEVELAQLECKEA